MHSVFFFFLCSVPQRKFQQAIISSRNQSMAGGSSDYDQVLVDIADYVHDYNIDDPGCWSSARLALMDALGCAIESLNKNGTCKTMVNAVISSSSSTHDMRLPGTALRLGPMQGAFALGTLIRYSDHNDSLGGAESGHPSGTSHTTVPQAPRS